MSATVLPFQPALPPDPAADAMLAELAQHGLAITRLVARLAEVEQDAAESLAQAAAVANRALFGKQASLADAIAAGQNADLSEAARNAAEARAAALGQTYERTARAVRRALALRARLASGRPFRAGAPPGEGPVAARPAAAARAANDAERAERMDDDWHDEIAGRSDAEVMQAIRRDLVGAGVAYSPGPPAGERRPRAGSSRGAPGGTDPGAPGRAPPEPSRRTPDRRPPGD